MSIQLLVVPARKLFGPSLRCRDDAERDENLVRFRRLLNVRCRSHRLHFDESEEAESEFFDFFVSEVDLLFRVVEDEFPDLQHIMESYIYVPVADSDERFHFDFPVFCQGERSIWTVSDMNSLKYAVSRLVAFNKTQRNYDRELLSGALRNYAEAISDAEHKGFLIFYSD